MTPEQVRAVYAATATAGRAELVLALGAALAEVDLIRLERDEARRERGAMQHLATKNRAEVDRLESVVREDRRQRAVGW